MKTRFLLSVLFAMPLFFYTPELEAQTPAIEPSGVFLYAQKDGQDLSLSIYDPAPGSETRLDGKTKPTIIFIFGGGFIEGERDHASYLPWYKRLSENGYRVVSIDYRLGLKGVTNLGLFNNRPLEHALRLSVDDLFSATAFLLTNAEELGIEPDNIVVSGSSAGAMTSLQAEWEICNHMPSTAKLPEGFNYAGILSFSGAIFSRIGLPSFHRDPAPTLFFHGTADKLVPYKQLAFLRTHFTGSDRLSRIFSRKGYNYCIYRFQGNAHEIAASMMHNFDREIEFLESNVIRGEKRIVDLVIDDPSIEKPDWGKATTKDLYK